MRILTVALLIVLLTSCTTYLIPKSSLVEQLAPIDSSQLVNKKVFGPVTGQYQYLANPITTIYCEDRNGEPQTLTNSPSIEMRVTETNNKKTIFYFDRTLIVDGQLVGVRSRFAPFVDKQIDLEDIQLIEIQDGKKNFRYAQ